MTQNLFWATGYNVIGTPLAAGLAAPFSTLLTLAVGAILMSVSTVVVSINVSSMKSLAAVTNPSSPPNPPEMGDFERETLSESPPFLGDLGGRSAE